MDYVDFTIQIFADGADRFRLRAQCPAGEVTEKFLPPYAPQDLRSSLWGLPMAEPSREVKHRDHGRLATAEEVGGRLFEALMPPVVRSRFDECLGAAVGVRIKLCLDPLDIRVAWLGLVPWEAIYRADRREFLGLSRLTPISRYHDTPHPTSPAFFIPPLRILAVIPRPRSVQELDLKREYCDLQKSWSEGTTAEVEPLERATPDALRGRLCQRWDILHFMGHGGFDDSRREGFLVFEDEDGGPKRMRDESLAILLQGTERPRLVVLNACETARTAADGGPAMATGAAPMLVRAGIPAVAAMLHPISDRAALLFNRTLHGRLAAGDPVDVAVAEGRRAIHGQMPWMEWIKPVLFMRVPDGRLFKDHHPEARLSPSGAEPSTADVAIGVLVSKDLVVGGVICEGDADSQNSAPGKASLQSEVGTVDRIILGGKIHLKKVSETGSPEGGSTS